jgi:hypothetical protein
MSMGDMSCSAWLQEHPGVQLSGSLRQQRSERGLCQPKSPSGVVLGTPGPRITPIVVVQSIEDGNHDEPSSPRPVSALVR